MDIYRCFTGRFLVHLEAVAGKPVDPRTALQSLIFAAYERAGATFLPAQMQLLGFCEILQTRDVRETMPLAYNGYNSYSDRSRKTAEEKFVEDRIIFHETIMELVLLANIKDNPFAEDEITRAARDLVDKLELSMWTIFAFQIFLDIHHILRDDISRGYQDLQEITRNIQLGIRQVLDYHGAIETGRTSPIDACDLQNTLKCVEQWVDFDIVGSIRASTYTQGITGLAVPPPFFLLRRHPLRCGLMAYAIQMTSQTLGIDLANDRGSILFATHLYNLVRQEGLTNKTWEDLNLELHFYKTETLFVGSPPTNAAECFKRYLIAMGSGSAVDFAKNRRKHIKRLTSSKAGIRKLNRISPISMGFWYRYCQPREQASFSPGDIEHVIWQGSLGKLKDNTLDASGLPEDLCSSAQRYCDYIASLSGQDKEDLEKPYKFNVRSVLLLDKLLRDVKSERIELSFNHFRLHVSCTRLLRAVEQAIADDLRERFEVDVSTESAGSLPLTVSFITMMAVEAEQDAQAWGTDKRALDIYRPLVKVANVIEKFLDSGAGGIECLMLKHFDLEIDVADILDVK